MKVALCAIAKKENKYLVEWVEHYKKLGFSKIFLYDNNDIDGEHPEDVLQSYVNDNFVQIINYRGKHICQIESYQNCYNTYNKDYDWMCFFDCDEFLTFKNNIFTDVNNFLSYEKFKEYNGILVTWEIVGDNENLYYNDAPLCERFKNVKSFDYHNVIVKSIIRCNIGVELKWNDMESSVVQPHVPIYISENIEIMTKVCNVYSDSVRAAMYIYDYLNHIYPIVLRHYMTKSTEEYMWKKLRHYPDQEYKNIDKLNFSEICDEYFSINTFSYKKISLMKKMFDDALKEYNKKDFSVALICIHKNHKEISKWVIDYWKDIRRQIKNFDVYVHDNGSTDGSLEEFKKYSWIYITDITNVTNGKLNTLINSRIKNEIWHNFKIKYDFIILCDFDECPYCEDWVATLRHLYNDNANIIYPKYCDMISEKFIPYDSNKLYHKVNSDSHNVGLIDIIEIRKTNKLAIIKSNDVDYINYLPCEELCFPVAKNMKPYYVNNIYIFHLHYIDREYAKKRNETNIKEIDEQCLNNGYVKKYFNVSTDEIMDNMLSNKVNYSLINYPCYKNY